MTSIRNTQQANDDYFVKVKMVNGMLLRRKHFTTYIYFHRVFTKYEKYRKYWVRIYIFFVHTGIYAVHFRVMIYQSGYFSCKLHKKLFSPL